MKKILLTAALSLLAGAATADDFAPVEGGRVWYQSCGTGPRAMVLIHDAVLDSAAFDDVWPLLCRDFHVVRYDRRGFGHTPAATAPYAATDDLAAVMHAAGIDHATLVASSAGGGLAVDFTLQHPAAVDRLVLAGPEVSGLALSQYFIRHTMQLLQSLKKGDIDAAVRDYRGAFAPGHDAALGRAVTLLKANPQNINHPDPARRAPPARPLLASLKTPTLILVGEYDSPDVQGWAGALEALIPGAKRVVVEDTGHMMVMEHPDVFAKLVTQFAAGSP